MWTSADSGETWTSREYAALPGTYGIAMSSDGTKLAANTHSGNIWTSTDSGANWAEVVVPKDSTQKWFEIASSSDGTKLAAALQFGHIWTSTDSGANWAEMKPTASTQKWKGITMSSDGTKLAAAVYNGNIWMSTDSGANWAEVKPTESTQAWSSITMSSDGTKLAAAVNGGNIWTSTTLARHGHPQQVRNNGGASRCRVTAPSSTLLSILETSGLSESPSAMRTRTSRTVLACRADQTFTEPKGTLLTAGTRSVPAWRITAC